MLPKKRSSGFTLIELMFVMTLMGILFAIGFAKYMEFNRRQIVLQETRRFKSNLRLAQSKAISAEKNASACQIGAIYGDGDDRTLDGWYVGFTGNSYSIYGSCGGVLFSNQTFSINNQVTIVRNPAAATSLQFKPATQGVKLNGAGNPSMPLIVNFRGFGIGHSVVISASGEVK